MGYLINKLRLIWWTLFYYTFNKLFFNAIGKSCRFEGWIDITQRGGKIILGNFCHVRRHVEFTIPKSGSLILGNNVFIGSGVVISAHGKVQIGDDVLIAEYVCIHDNDHNYYDLNTPISMQGYNIESCIIGNGCWIGAGTKILKGSSLGKYSVLGAGSVLTKALPDHIIAVGVPAKIIKQRTFT